MNTTEGLRELEKAATPGPWQPLDRGLGHDFDRSHVLTAESATIVRASYADAQFIAAARNALPLLLDVVEAAREVKQACWEPWDDGAACDRAANALTAALAALDAAEAVTA